MAAMKGKRTAKRKASPARKAKKTGKRPTKKAKMTARKSGKAAANKAPAKKDDGKRTLKKTVGEGDYAASRAFLKDQSGFVAKNKAKIPAMGKAAEAALNGPDGAALRDAEATAAARSRDIF